MKMCEEFNIEFEGAWVQRVLKWEYDRKGLIFPLLRPHKEETENESSCYRIHATLNYIRCINQRTP